VPPGAKSVVAGTGAANAAAAPAINAIIATTSAHRRQRLRWFMFDLISRLRADRTIGRRAGSAIPLAFAISTGSKGVVAGNDRQPLLRLL
jgi:hypothetical protein